ncbi:hypothetical protein D3C81_1796370 [compost metagenome]
MQLHQRVLHHEAGQHRPHPEIQQRRGATDTHHTLGFGAVAFDHLGRAFGLHHHGHAMAVVLLADLGDREVPRGALDQAHAEALLQVGDAPAELGLGHVQRTPGRGEAAVLHHLGEVVEVVEVFHQRSPNRTLRAI